MNYDLWKAAVSVFMAPAVVVWLLAALLVFVLETGDALAIKLLDLSFILAIGGICLYFICFGYALYSDHKEPTR